MIRLRLTDGLATVEPDDDGAAAIRAAVDARAEPSAAAGVLILLGGFDSIVDDLLDE